MPIGDDSIRIASDLRAAVGAAADAETRQLIRAWARAWDDIAATLDAAAIDIANLDRAPTIGEVRRLERARRAMATAHDRIVTVLNQSADRVTTTVADVTAETIAADTRLIAAQLPRSAGTIAELAVRFDRVNPIALDAIVERTTQQITSLAWPLADDATEQMLRALTRGVAQGLSPRDAARQMVRRTETAFNGGLSRAMTIARTEILDAYRQAAAMSHAANDDVLAGWVWFAQLDRRTCPSCIAQHGTLHPLQEPGPDDHQNGRCARMPKTKTWSELGFTQRERPDMVKPGADWFAEQPTATQMSILGPGRYQLYRDGKTTIADMTTRRRNPGWRPSHVPTPLRDLV